MTGRVACPKHEKAGRAFLTDSSNRVANASTCSNGPGQEHNSMLARHLPGEATNVRPYLLGICFAWGLVCGFLFHAISKSDTYPVSKPVPKPKVTDAATTESPAARKPDPATRPLRPVAPRGVMPPSAGVPSAPPEASGSDEEAGDIVENPPQHPRLALLPSDGLTALTAPPPGPPSLLDRPGPKVPKTPVRREWTPVDDPEIVF